MVIPQRGPIRVNDLRAVVTMQASAPIPLLRPIRINDRRTVSAVQASVLKPLCGPIRPDKGRPAFAVQLGAMEPGLFLPGTHLTTERPVLPPLLPTVGKLDRRSVIMMEPVIVILLARAVREDHRRSVIAVPGSIPIEVLLTVLPPECWSVSAAAWRPKVSVRVGCHAATIPPAGRRW